MNFLTNLDLNDLLTSLPLVGMYAETHFRFWFPFSRYFRQQPEMIFDAPWRLEPGQDLSIFLVIKDANLFPVRLENVEVKVQQLGNLLGSQSWQIERSVDQHQSHLEFTLDEIQSSTGPIEIQPSLTYSIGTKKFQMTVDNYSQISKPPLRVYVGSEKIPQLKGWLNGDTHLHTSWTTDQIEFGASSEMTRRAAELFGMDFITATDHSYDLDDLPDNYLKNDPELQKWKASREFLKKQNQTNKLTTLPGEEVSVANARGATVHLLHFNDSKYFPGSGDSGDDWPQVKSELSIDHVLSQRSEGTASIGAHTAYQFPFLPRTLLNRGTWEGPDHDNPKLDGVQILCGTPSSQAFQDSRQLWIEALLKGNKLGVYGGSDGHGNLNRNWHVKVPMWSLGIHEDQIFGQSRTLLRSESTTTSDLIHAMKFRRSALSTGPVGELILKDGPDEYHIGDIHTMIKDSALGVQMSGLSSAEFGSNMDITLYFGDQEKQEEVIIHREEDLQQSFQLEVALVPPSSGYIRMEITSEGSRWPGVYISSPIWIVIGPQ